MPESQASAGLDHVGEKTALALRRFRFMRSVGMGSSSAFEARARFEVVGMMNWLIAAVNQASGRWAVTAPHLAVGGHLKALKLVKNLLCHA